MEHLRNEICLLIDRLESTFPQPGSPEANTLERLRSINTAAQAERRAVALSADFSALRQYWLSSIDWCSQLSRDIEKLLIVQEEQADAEIGAGGKP